MTLRLGPELYPEMDFLPHGVTNGIREAHPSWDAPTDVFDHRKRAAGRIVLPQAGRGDREVQRPYRLQRGRRAGDIPGAPGDAVVLHSSVQDVPCDAMVKKMKSQQPD